MVYSSRRRTKEGDMIGIGNVMPHAAQTNPVTATVKKSGIGSDESKSDQTKPERTTTDTVQLSQSAKAMAQASVEEATETSTETAKEARNGDHQAQRLIAREGLKKPLY
jgi:hypothetical protein